MITIDNISFAYSKDLPIFTGFSLELKKGALFGLLGPNGAGKTSLISLIAGLHKPSSGQITINGKAYTKKRQDFLRGLSLVPQEYAFYAKLSAQENLQFFSSLYPDNVQENIEEAIELTGLQTYRNRIAGSFSGGLKRRLNLAIGLVNKPSLLILDEPTVGIDPQSRHFILEAIQELNKQGTTVLYTSHYMNEIEKICTQIAIIDQGKILCQGSLNELLSNNAALNIEVKPTPGNQILPEPVQQLISAQQLTFTNNTIAARHIHETNLIELLNLLNKHNINIEHVKYGRQSLEDLFFTLTNTHLRED